MGIQTIHGYPNNTWLSKPYISIQTIHGHPKSCMVWKEQASRDPYVHGLKSPFPTTTTGITSRPVGLRPQVKRLHSVQKVGIPKKIGGRERGGNFGTRVSSSRTDLKINMWPWGETLAVPYRKQERPVTSSHYPYLVPPHPQRIQFLPFI